MSSHSNEDHDFVIGKVRKVSKDGESLADAELGTGGLRWDDGTIAALVEDLRVIRPGEENYAEYLDDEPPGDDPYQNASTGGGSEETEDADLAALIGGAAVLAVALLGAVIVGNREEIKGWITQRIIDPLGTVWQKLRRKLGRKHTTAELAVLEIPETSPGELAAEIEEHFQNEQVFMTNEEAKKRYLEIVLSMEFLARKIREYEQAVVVDEEQVLELKNLAALVTSPQGHKMLENILQTEDMTLDSATKIQLRKILNGAPVRALEQGD